MQTEANAIQSAWEMILNFCSQNGLEWIDLTWRDEEPQFGVEFPSRVYSEEYRIACGIPTVLCENTEQQTEVRNMFETIQNGLKEKNFSA